MYVDGKGTDEWGFGVGVGGVEPTFQEDGTLITATRAIERIWKNAAPSPPLASRNREIPSRRNNALNHVPSAYKVFDNILDNQRRMLL